MPPLCRCTIDGQDTFSHASAGYCPIRKFGTGVKPDNWQVIPMTVSAKPAPPKAPGPGSSVRDILRELGYREENGMLVCANRKVITNCGCDGFAAQMDQWGWEGCEERWPDIVQWFFDKAMSCGGSDVFQWKVARAVKTVFKAKREALRDRV